jgi:integrase
MGKAIEDENSGLRERFQFRDLRAKSASDDTAEAASKRLGHSDPKITERVYRRRAERAKPRRGKTRVTFRFMIGFHVMM